MAYILLIVSLGVILVAAEIFTNGVEWLGVRLNLSEGAVGSILAAVGTAMPESLIPLIAFISGKGIEQQHIGIGAIIGAPFMLSTLAFFISGLVVVLEAKKRLDFPYLRVDERVIRRDITFFFVGYGLGLGAAFMTNPAFKYLIAAFLIGWYCLYVWLTLRSGRGAGHSSDLRSLYFSASKKTPRLMLIAFQVLVAITLLIVGANLFVKEVSVIAELIGIPSFFLSLIIAPIATELPEKFNSVIWLLQEKDTLALGNITGAMVFQSVVLPSIGIIFTNWHFVSGSLVPVVLTFLSAGLVYLSLLWKRKLNAYVLLAGGFFYIIFLWAMLH
ncbi:sodium:calcium antiporter [Syntrophaceticus schinkii]|uniref:Sodium/calcium exchanger membrane region n=1 Tax=Syntrophaceticus schinkii TaxID=499207 RepID=A0A0B7MK52_9FIRM|nr:sodium:calcium antiporter [Syntrophaceticus schinkii]CEO90415.1 Sodium/calcium exchanger membrane region [Syntrophaceticus schinkii]